MTSVNNTEERCLAPKNIIPAVRNKHNHVVTSTPIKKQTSELLKIDQCPFSMRQSPTASQSYSPIVSHTLEKGNQENKRLDGSIGAATKSIDKICLVNDLARKNDTEKKNLLPDDGDNAEKIVVKKRWIILDSDEEEILKQNKSKTVKKRKNLASLSDTENRTRTNKSRKENVAKSSTPNVREEQNEESDNVAEMKPQKSGESRIDVPRLKERGSRISESIRRSESSDDSNPWIIVRPSKKLVKTKNRDDDENTNVRKSTRKKCKPLEFWMGERMTTIGDLSSEIEKVEARKNSRKKKSKQIQDAELESETIKNVPNVAKFSPETKANSTVERDDKKSGKIKTWSKLTRDKNSKAKVRSFFAGTETTTDNRPAGDENLMPVGETNFVDLLTLTRQRLPINESFITVPQLKNFMGIVSSAVVVINTKSFLKSRASDQRHLIFCVMSGTVKVLITIEGAETNEEMKTCGHFVVARGALYSIENVGEKNAILSRFEIPCGTEYQK